MNGHPSTDAPNPYACSYLCLALFLLQEHAATLRESEILQVQATIEREVGYLQLDQEERAAQMRARDTSHILRRMNRCRARIRDLLARWSTLHTFLTGEHRDAI